MSTPLHLEQDDLDRLIAGTHWNPRALLGPHPCTIDGRRRLVIRAWFPHAAQVSVIPTPMSPSLIPMIRLHEAGLFEAVVPEDTPVPLYRFTVTRRDGTVIETHDPYAFPPLLTDFELHLFAEGTWYRTYERLGSHVRGVEDVAGVHFVVWAPNAARVSVIGDFNRWDGRCHPMISRGATGLWELFVPDLQEDALYKYEILSRHNGALLVKADPYAYAGELRPRTASIVRDLSRYVWRDHDWMAARAHRNPLTAPLAIYEVHLGSWMRVPEEGDRWLTYQELAQKLIPYAKDLGYTHLELLPVTEHPFDGSWGYQSTGYFAATSRYGRPEEFMAFVDAAHQAGLGVIMDWSPAHFPDDPHGLATFDGTHLYDHADPRRGYHPDWHSRIFNYDRPEVRLFLLNSALFWLDRYHIDGLRVDAVASMLYLDYGRKPGEWIPNEFGGHENLGAVSFIKDLNVLVHREHPGAIMIAEESTAWPGVSRPTYAGGLGFTFKWNMGWMHDMLEYFARDPVHRRFHQDQITFGLLYAFSENFVLALSHDEVVHGKRSLLDKMPGDFWQRFANLRLLYSLMYGHPGKKMLFMGGEFGQWREWNHDRSLDWHLCDYEPHRGLQRLVRDLNHLHRTEPALHEADFDWSGFQWIDFHDTDNSVIAFLRKSPTTGRSVVCVYNLTPVPRHDYRIGVPESGWYRELLNSDAGRYGGSDVGNGGGISSSSLASHHFPYSLLLTLPPLAALFLKRE
ncbi:1,4-alpha-glucan branching protein GlgB [Candidatus Nitrospira inopinata]|jgi:1,4-alpha-glucan branching enzyme|uniref:1,4-alpha-glucan branching enzyme GlgB n=1 Tax=Candidatus Nitrospira inopinata TaxID=1715989 RepID=A0A0S4KTH6_9BACT|nr:1,4-alpha-glucan branching protein GlgB [Candidatus Nitrospira inopinata]CUQ64994.1 1,4-alpha-glucan branching enzyme [Candidatus Nitrospira inopinata]